MKDLYFKKMKVTNYRGKMCFRSIPRRQVAACGEGIDLPKEAA